MADVYAADDALRNGADVATPGRSFEYIVTADPDPDVLSRVANQLNFANSAPWRVEMGRNGEGLIVVRIEMREITATVAESIRRKLLQLTCVIDVRFVRVDTPAETAVTAELARAD